MTNLREHFENFCDNENNNYITGIRNIPLECIDNQEKYNVLVCDVCHFSKHNGTSLSVDMLKNLR